MGLYKIKVQLLGLLIFFTSCSKSTLSGLYSDYRVVVGTQVAKNLVLNADSTFNYSESFSSAFVGDLPVDSRNFVGKGKYTVNGDKLTMTFAPQIRKIYKIDISLSSNRFYADTNNWSIEYKIDRESFGYDMDMFTVLVKADNKTLFGYNTDGSGTPKDKDVVKYYKSIFPQKIVLDFKKLAGRRYPLMMSGMEYIDYQRLLEYPGDKDYAWAGSTDMGYNCGFFDEEVNIEKPGNYVITLYPFKSHDVHEQVITGKRIYQIKESFWGRRVGKMKKSKHKRTLKPPRSVFGDGVSV